MGAIWSDEARFGRMLEVELAVAEAQARRGLVPGDALEAIRSRAVVDVERIRELERTSDHEVVAVVVARAREHGTTVMMGRTHSVHAEPTTLGLKLAGWAFELDRARERLGR